MCPNMRCDVFCQKILASKHGLISPFMCTVCFHCRHFICELCIAVSIFFSHESGLLWATSRAATSLSKMSSSMTSMSESSSELGHSFSPAPQLAGRALSSTACIRLSEVGRQQYSDAGTGGSLPCQVKWFPFLSLVHCYMDLFYRSLLGIWKHYS